MFELSVKTRFSAAHHLVEYPGACAALHGHNWDVEVFVRGEELNEIGILTDFKVLKGSLKKLVDDLDHSDLNTIGAFKTTNPTSENLARFMYRQLSAAINCEQYRIHRVSVNETPEARATYWEENTTSKEACS